MKQFFISLLVLALSTQASADCDWSKIISNPDGTFIYSKALHICVGQMKQDLTSANIQLTDYKKAIDLKDLALKTSDDRANMWMSTSLTLEKDIQEVDKLRSGNETLYFGLGILTVFAAGYIVKTAYHY